MGIIHVLDKSIAELIAAGEVVERPASAVKELVENAIDAGATSIVVEIKNGGMSLIRVTDNGCGFYPEDVKNAFLRHATSKVKTASDLDAILTMGFRGEALASIAAVSRVELLSRRADSVEGVRYGIEASEEKFCEPAGCPVGTTITVRDLFYNTPARLKFLKKDQAEANAVAGMVEKLALIYPEISFRFVKDEQEKLRTPGDGQALSAIYAVFGRDFAAGLLPVDYSLNGLTVTGFVSKPHKARASRSMQNFYINRRYVKSRTCAAALEEGFKHATMSGRFPACVLDITLPAEKVDVNVHPAKIEVRFDNEKPIFDLVYFAVKNALRQGDVTVQASLGKTKDPPMSTPPKERMSAAEFQKIFGQPQKDKGKTTGYPKPRSVPPSSPVPAEPAAKTTGLSGMLEDDTAGWITYDTSGTSALSGRQKGTGKVYSPSYWNRTAALDVEAEPHLHPQNQKQNDQRLDKSGPLKPLSVEKEKPEKPTATAVEEVAPVQQTLEDPRKPYEDLRYIGEVFRTYILFSGEGKLVLVDKHAAHERILYNRLKDGVKEQFVQNLLAPVTVVLSKEEHAVAMEHLSVLEECGFEAEDFGSGTLMVRSAPMWLESDQIEDTVTEICAYLAEGKQDVSPERLDWLYHNVACRSAVKGGDRSSAEELKEILRLMREDGEVFHCPHGRPVAVILTQKEIEKQFGRT